MKHQNNNLEALLRDRGIKVTTKRLEVLMIIAQSDVATPYSKIQKKLNNFDRVTLYRTLNTLLGGGIIHKASVSSQDIYYAMCKHYCTSGSHNHKHIHFKCVECLSVSCVDTTDPISIEIENVAIKEIEIEVKGICTVCLKNSQFS